jgi:hypothetical protein
MCPVRLTVTRLASQICPAGDLAVARKGLGGHVWSRGRTCLVIFTGIRQRTQISPESYGKLGSLNMSDFAYWYPARKPYMFGISREIGSRKFFDDLQFTNSLNASPLIVQSSYDINKNKSY